MADAKPDKVVKISPERYGWLRDFIRVEYGDTADTGEIAMYEPTEVRGIMFLRALYQAA